MKRLQILFFFIIVLWSPFSSALVLNELVISRQGDNLVGQIKVDDLINIQQDQIVIEVGDPSLYRQLGLAYNSFLTGLAIEYRTIDSSQGIAGISLPYQAAVDSFDLVIQIQWPQGQLVRRYVVQGQPNLFTGDEGIRISINPVEVQLNQADQQAARVAEINRRMAGVQVDTVEGDSWRNVAEAIRQAYLREEEINIEQVMLALRDSNPQDFSGSQSSVLHIGASLQLPDYYEITLYDSEEARQVIAAIFRSRATKPLLTLSVAEPEPPSNDNIGLRESLDASYREEEDLEQQLSLVDAQLEQVERLIALKEQEIAMVQLAAEQQETVDPLLRQNQTSTEQQLQNLEAVIRDRIDTFFMEVRSQPFFWFSILVIIVLCSLAYILIRRAGHFFGYDRASLMRQLRRESMRNADQQSHLFEQDDIGSDDDIRIKQPRIVKPSEKEPVISDQVTTSPPGEVSEARKQGALMQDDVKRANLDLARAYINMGEHNQARPLLQEVIKKGSEEEKQQAGQLLDQITNS